MDLGRREVREPVLISELSIELKSCNAMFFQLLVASSDPVHRLLWFQCSKKAAFSRIQWTAVGREEGWNVRRKLERNRKLSRRMRHGSSLLGWQRPHLLSYKRLGCIMSGIRLDSYFLFWSNPVFLCDHSFSKPAREVQSGLHPVEAAEALAG